ncbi:glycosyl transferases group 1 family protein [Synechococcus sp. A15-127]|uniref:glycosyltransferase n=1 Tax=Synechococcus sp. A15-127 TaxID=1050624 RepID=UPI0016462DA0|nr:glycosyltransferase [Synechococcus sp. A15-127]QNI95461.1 glycosyl transferases group 1 family protein [Synechococcus sp. A15-127]
MSVLYVSHGHPVFAKGGGELAAWRLFEAFRSKPGFEGSGFLAAASSPDQLPAGSEVVGLSADEWLIKRSPNPFFHDTAVNLCHGGQLHQALAGRCFQIIHLHHYLHVGIDLVLALKRWFPKAKLLLTLHDYWGPCVYEGRLLRASGELCSGGDPEACDQCLGGGRRGELSIRSQRLQRLFGVIDHLLCPSLFLKQRYLDWGVDPKKISVLENLPAPDSSHQVPLSDSDLLEQSQEIPLVVGYFGQVNPWKGLSLLIEAIGLLRSVNVAVQLEVNGAHADDFESIPDGVRFNGRYEPEDLPQRMACVHVVAMASTWYENSPMVIQEAFQYGRPVIVPNLGGMAEKVQHDFSGLLFKAGSANAIAIQIKRLIQEDRLLSNLRANIAHKNAIKIDECDCHQKIYTKLAAV